MSLKEDHSDAEYNISNRKIESSNLVDCRIVDDLVGDVHFALWVLLAGFISHLYCSLHTPTVAVCLR